MTKKTAIDEATRHELYKLGEEMGIQQAADEVGIARTPFLQAVAGFAVTRGTVAMIRLYMERK